MSEQRIVVGVDGSIGSALAVSWAVDECKLHHAMLLIVHCPDITQVRTAAIYAEAGMRAIDRRSEQILTSFSHAASARQPSVPVTSLLSYGNSPDALTELSLGAQLLVVGSHGRGLLDRGIGRIAAAQARCPVLVVPTVSGSETGGAVTQVVHVVIDDPTDEVAARFARREAAVREVPLHIVQWPTRSDPRSPGALTVVGRGTTDGPCTSRPTIRADLLLDRLLDPLVVVGPAQEGDHDRTPNFWPTEVGSSGR